MPTMAYDWPFLSWAFPLLYFVHVAEEHWCGGGFCAYVGKAEGVRLTPRRFVLMTGLGGLLMVAGIPVAESLDFPEALLVVFGTILLANGLAHALSGAQERRYHPGLVSGALVWVPVGAITLISFLGDISWRSYAISVSVGLGIQMAVSRLAVSGGR